MRLFQKLVNDDDEGNENETKQGNKKNLRQLRTTIIENRQHFVHANQHTSFSRTLVNASSSAESDQETASYRKMTHLPPRN